MSNRETQQSIDVLLECPITGTRFVDPVIADDGHTYERQAIIQWLRQQTTSPITRQPMSIDSLRPNYIIKQMLELEKKAERQNYRFRLNIDVRKKRNRALFQNGDKFIYEAEWLNNEQGPEIVVLHIRGARASKEASFYVKLSRHPNIVRTFGIVESINEENIGVMLLQEYASLGDLSELLLNEPTLPNNVHVIYEIFLQIIDAMSYLVSKNVVHGDLACRNILVFSFHHTESQKILVKLTDFGLTRASTIYQTTNYATSTINIIPFRSSAPEILQSSNDRKFYTEKSDIFSMGVLMWECLSKGAIPWIDLPEDEVKRKVLNGERLKRPRNDQCSNELWAIILKCMAHRQEERPTFVQLDRLISDLFSNRIPIYRRYAQYISLQHQQNGETSSNNRSSATVTAANSRPSSAIDNRPPASAASIGFRQETEERQNTASQNIPEFSQKKLDCNGRACYKCGRCREWRFYGPPNYWHKIRNWANWTTDDWLVYQSDNWSRGWHRRFDATCTSLVLEAGDHRYSCHKATDAELDRARRCFPRWFPSDKKNISLIDGLVNLPCVCDG